MREIDVLVIGAGPSGAIASAILHKNKDLKVLVVEKERFPRFVIGESLLPFCMNILEEAGFLDSVQRYGFQFKNGAAFNYKDEYRYFDFCDKSSDGYGTTYQVQRADFDKLLIECAISQGVEVKFETMVENFSFNTDYVEAKLSNGDIIRARFIVDASGYGRVLPRMLDLEAESNLPCRKAYFTHIQDNIKEILYDRKKILVSIHPDFRDVWFWLIPFANGKCSIGVVGSPDLIDNGFEKEIVENDFKSILKTHTYSVPILKRLLIDSKWDMDVRSIESYSKDVKKLYGDKFILLGNASEFLDPVFSSGVTIAMYSASLAGKLIPRILNGEELDLEKEYAEELMYGINAFRTYVNGWYDGRFQDVIFTKNENNTIKRQICSILAGYAWDKKNPYAYKSETSLNAVWKYC